MSHIRTARPGWVLYLSLLLLLPGLALFTGGMNGPGNKIICPGENVPSWSEGEEVPGPMHPGDSCGVIVGGNQNGGTRSYEQQKAVQAHDATRDLWIGVALLACSGAGLVWTGSSVWRSRRSRRATSTTTSTTSDPSKDTTSDTTAS
ncbi:hypothetical protein QR77_29025 [Streptomyces sp. 150FB]|uniref:hypothetical protein n=1 Tax=Streptomyces sp. 150FB TaxID=1576605 RepID=UPI000588EAB4|nr:hypothetical protein [Streptomyces sp. 150FB]KIF76817.1 hypothetical protein QR77_29025 [Streptomyces sp. 150FB]